MRLGSPIPLKRARIEIIPLIDVMFFLLASFMMVSLSMQRLRTLKMDLPSAVKAKSTSKPDMVEVKVNRNGDITIDSKHHSLPEFIDLLTQRRQANTNLPVYVKADTMATHGDVLRIIDTAKSAGITRVSFQLDSEMPAGR